MFRVSKSIGTESRLVAAKGRGEGRVRSDYFVRRGFILGEENVLELDRGGCTALRMFVPTLLTIN